MGCERSQELEGERERDARRGRIVREKSCEEGGWGFER
ncbi:hypothetical protein chiPu_0030850, partial [Chiloscyllium punctatum]|nr:hypothetical protein [Chiloscyllium punctatum]